MIRRIDLRGAATGGGTLVDYRAAVPRAEFDVEAAVPAVHRIIEDVRTRGVEAIRDLSLQHDGVAVDDPRVPAAALADALAGLDADVRAALEESIARLRETCAAELEREVTTEVGAGARVTRRIVPVDRVGLYVPGGLAPLVSSVLMNVVPAQTAGVGCRRARPRPRSGTTAGSRTRRSSRPARCSASRRCTPSAVPRRSRCSPTASASAPRSTSSPDRATSGPSPPSGCSRAWSASTPRPGPPRSRSSPTTPPTRRTSPPTWSARPSTTRWLPPCSSPTRCSLADDVERELEKQVHATKHTERILQSLGGAQSAIVLVDDVEQGLEVVNAYAAEHLELHTADAASLVPRIRNAGAIFVGPHAPVSLGDYCAGSNHVLPTGGCACHSSGLSVRAFTRTVQVVDYTREALAEVADHVVALAEAEDLPGHGAAVRVRFEG